MFIIDVDGCLTDGGFYYTKNGKAMKRFGPDDADALEPYRDKVVLISADKRGFRITARRADDMGLKLYPVPARNRLLYLRTLGFDMEEHLFMGDGFLDTSTLQACRFGIAPANAATAARAVANYVTARSGGDRAVAEAVRVLEREGLL